MTKLTCILVTAILGFGGLACSHQTSRETSTQEEVSAKELFRQAKNLITELEGVSSKGKLTKSDTENAWQAIYRMGSANDCKYDDTVQLYRLMHTFNLPPNEKLDTIRILGQDLYLRGKHQQATAMFSKAFDISADHLSGADEQDFFRYLGNVVQLNARSLKKSGDSEASITMYRKITESPRIMANIPQSSVAHSYYYLGDLLMQAKKYADASATFQTGLKWLKDNPDVEADDDYRIDLEIGCLRSKVMENDPDKPDYRELLDQLDELKDEFESEMHPEFDLILRTRVIVAGKLEDKKFLVENATELREFYVEKHEVVGELGESKYYLMDCSALLIKHYANERDAGKAIELLRETKKLADPRKTWFNQFPKSLTREAFSKSVLDEKLESDK